MKVAKTKELQDVTITHVSYVKRGANKKQFFVAKNEDGAVEVEFNGRFFAKSDDEEQKLLYGIVYEPDQEDAHGDFMTEQQIEKTAHEFLEYYRNIDTEHNLVAGAGTVVESYVAPIELNIEGTIIKKGSWILATKASDETWEAWKNGDITGYSMFGIARNAVTSKGESTLKKMFAKTLEKLGLSKSFDETVQSRIEEMTQSPWFVMDMLREDFYKEMDWNAIPAENLKVLSKSLREAADYVDSKIAEISTVAKSGEVKPETKTDEGSDNVGVVIEKTIDAGDNNAEQKPESTPEPEIPEVKPEPDTVTKTEEPVVENPEPVKKSTEETIAEIIIKSNEPLMKKLDEMGGVVEKLQTENQALVKRLEIIETGSGVRTEGNPVTKSESPVNDPVVIML